MIKATLTCSALLGLLLVVSPTPAEAGRNRAVRGRAVPPALAPHQTRGGSASRGIARRGSFVRSQPQNGRAAVQPIAGQSFRNSSVGRRGLASQRQLGNRGAAAMRQPAAVRSPQALQAGQFGYRGARAATAGRSGLSSNRSGSTNLRGQWTGNASGRNASGRNALGRNASGRNALGRNGRTPFGRTASSPARDTRTNQGLLGLGNTNSRSNLVGGQRSGLSSQRSAAGALGRGNNALGRTNGSNRSFGANRGNGRPALPTPIVDRAGSANRGVGRGSFGSGRSRVGTTRGNARGGRGQFGYGNARNHGVPSSLGAQSPALRTGRTSHAGHRGHGRHAYRGHSRRIGRWRSLWSSHYYFPTYPTSTVIEYVAEPYVESVPYVEQAPYIAPQPYVEQEPYVAPVPYVPNEQIGPNLPAAPGQQGDAFDRGAQAFEAAQWRTAQEWFDKAVRADPQDGEAWLGLLHTSLMLDRYVDAATAITRVADLGGIGPGYDLDPRDVYGDNPVAYDAAVVRLERYVARYPRDGNALLAIAFIRIARGDHALARSDVARLRSIDRTNQMADVLTNAMRAAPALSQAPQR